MGRRVEDKTQNNRIGWILGMVDNGAKFSNLVNDAAIDAKNRIDANRRRYEAQRAAFDARAEFKIGILEKVMSREDAIVYYNSDAPVYDDSPDKADLGRVDAATAIVNALATLATHGGTLRHVLTSEAGKDLVNSLF